MNSCRTPRFLVSLLVVLVLTSLTFTLAFADKGVIVHMTRKCFVISTNMGYVIVDGWVSAKVGDAVIGSFNTYGSTKIFDRNGNDISGYIYIEDWGLSKSSFQNKWQDKYREKCE
jgi:hypothetical protein